MIVHKDKNNFLILRQKSKLFAMPYKVWRVISFLISGLVAWVINPYNFGISPTNDIPLNIIIKIAVFLILYFILSKLGKSKKEN